MMRLSNIFWGLILIFFGVILLLENFDLVTMDWWSITQLWPLLIVYLGLLFFPERLRLPGVVLLFVIIVVFAFFKMEWRSPDDNGASSKGMPRHYEAPQSLTLPFDSSYQYAQLRVEGGPGNFQIRDTTGKMAVISGHRGKGWKSFNLNHSRKGDTFAIKTALKKSDFSESASQPIRMLLNKQPRWHMDFDIGASKADFNLAPYKVEQLDLKAGASTIDLKLGSRQSKTQIHVDAGASAIQLKIPESSGCRIKSDADLSNLDFDGFRESREETWVSPDFEEADSKVFLKLDAGLSHLAVERY